MINELTFINPLMKIGYYSNYRKNIRAMVDWDYVRKNDFTVGMDMIVNGKSRDALCYYHCWDKGTGSFEGRKKVEIIEPFDDIIIRIPAVRYKNKIILLDGNHRVSEIQPFLVIVDYLYAKTKRQARVFVDLFSRGFLN